MELPPGFRFHPTDEEIITFYLTQKVINSDFTATAIGEADLNKCEPWDLPKMAKMGEKEWYFFFRRDRKYPTGMRTNRATVSGYWKATGKDKEIYRKSILVGMKKTLVFYTGRAPKGDKSNWVMHEFRLHGHPNLPTSAKDEWVVSRVFHKNDADKNKKIAVIAPDNSNTRNYVVEDGDRRLLRINSLGVDDMLDPSNSLPPLADFEIIPTPPYNYNNNNNNIYNPNMNMNNNNNILVDNSYYQCKAEQFSISANHSMDTALSTDNYAEISSNSKHHHFEYDFGDIPWDDL